MVFARVVFYYINTFIIYKHVYSPVARVHLLLQPLDTGWRYGTEVFKFPSCAAVVAKSPSFLCTESIPRISHSHTHTQPAECTFEWWTLADLLTHTHTVTLSSSGSFLWTWKPAETRKLDDNMRRFVVHFGVRTVNLAGGGGRVTWAETYVLRVGMLTS